MAPRTDLNEVAAHALRICEDMRDPDVGSQWHYSELAGMCLSDPECMAQVIMCLAAWVPFEQVPSALADRAQAVAAGREDALRFMDRSEVFA